MDQEPIHPLQAMLDGASAQWQKRRSQTQMTLGKLIETLKSLDPERRIVGLGDPMSYRGYYSDLSFDPSTEILTVAAALHRAKECMGEKFMGYKGGDFYMSAATPLWSANYGDCGFRIMGLNLAVDPITLDLKEEES